MNEFNNNRKNKNELDTKKDINRYNNSKVEFALILDKNITEIWETEIGKFPDEVKLGMPEKFYSYQSIIDQEDKIKYKNPREEIIFDFISFNRPNTVFKLLYI